MSEFMDGYVTGQDSRNNGGAWGESWIWILVVFALLFGWGGNGGGIGGFARGGGSFGGGVTDGYVLASDFSNIERKIDGVYSGICDSTFALNNTINNGFASAQNTMTQGFAGLNTGMITQGYETRNAINGIGTQMAQCCCDIREGISGVNYNMATQANGLSRDIERGFCDTQYRDMQNTNALMQSGHSDADRIIAKLDAMENARKDETIARQNQEIFQQQLIRELGYQCPKPAYVVQPPQQVTFPTNCCGGTNYAAAFGGGCGCNG